MRPIAMIPLAAVIAMATSGCGTVCNVFSENPQIYGGITNDLTFLQSDKQVCNLGGYNFGSNNPWAIAFVVGLFAAEPAMSFVGDTLTLPYVYCVRRSVAHGEFDDSAPVEPGFSTVDFGNSELPTASPGNIDALKRLPGWSVTPIRDGNSSDSLKAGSASTSYLQGALRWSLPSIVMPGDR